MAKFSRGGAAGAGAGAGQARMVSSYRNGHKTTLTKAELAVLAEMVIVIDTREQAPFRFAGHQVKFGTLAAGDYSIDGFTDKVSIERKTLGDYLSSIGSGRDRFKRELVKLGALDVSAVVVEADHSHVSGGQHPISKVPPEAATATMVAIWLDYRVPVFCCANRVEAEKFTLRVLQRFFLKRRGLR
jgi:ERCC4-type nuclease